MDITAVSVLTLLYFVCVRGLAGNAEVQSRMSHKLTTLADMRPVVKRSVSRDRRAESAFTEAEINESLDAHNSRRAQEGASNMKFMVWNSYLASMAQDWADGCLFEHGHPSRDPATMPYTDPGQNLFLSTASFPIETAVQAFYNEKQWYDYDSRTCATGKVCGHYTQVVWAASFEVGCAMAFCPIIRENNGNTYSNAYYFVCNYGPGGNYVGAKPFKKGESCTQCDSGNFACQPTYGLCDTCTVGGSSCSCAAACRHCGTVNADCSCTCRDGWSGVDCSEVCENHKTECGTTWPKFLCTYSAVHKARMERDCPLLCGTCVASTGGSVCDTTNRANTTTSATTTSATTTTPTTTTQTTPITTAPTTTTTSATTRTTPTTTTQTTPTTPITTPPTTTTTSPTTPTTKTVATDKEETKIGVIIRLRASISQWPRIWRYIRPVIMKSVNTVCGGVKWAQCCPAGSTKNTNGTGRYLTQQTYIQVGTGYPTQIDKSAVLKALLYVQYDPDNDLCGAPGGTRDLRGMRLFSMIIRGLAEEPDETS